MDYKDKNYIKERMILQKNFLENTIEEIDIFLCQLSDDRFDDDSDVWKKCLEIISGV